jgi:hypothetical protein
MKAGLLPARNDRRKVNLIQIKVTQYFCGFIRQLKDRPGNRGNRHQKIF